MRSSGAKAARHTDQRHRGRLVEPLGNLGAGAPGPIPARADDDVGTADGEGFDAKRCQNLELSRWSLRSRTAPVP